ncbi:MAG: triose-phosphate isomerase [Nanoarchaeota archaeon]
MKKRIMAANWKLHKENSEAADYLRSLKERVVDVLDREIIVAPSFVSLVTAYDITRDSNISIAAQNVFYEGNGAYTGEVSAPMIKNFCKYVIIGHSERRSLFNETNEVVRKKLEIALENGLIPILCIGETIEQRNAKKTFEILEDMLSVLAGLKGQNLIIAYEPVWAISGGNKKTKPATAEDAEEAHRFIRNLVQSRTDASFSNLRIIYGGSVKPENVSQLMEKPNVEGALVGSASLTVEGFEKLIRF